ncbi:MarR family transcriptional regulator [Brevirhabdus pacifica]|uniref:MarR family transcriptional regulator n=1 Tax=Brevirhabdus pacifica TaxID=1267768 RepID=A0A1U7DFJ3_9RHOB|nr:MarR family transcriptional regulator [Brevirhabdus pacifica]APX88742.1 MarR family transcriptional regulator [Brevirhabdus pacifica]OWU79999.1 MarR family transcriptional regulator [Loktanella sp. 22II-4b]PJJ86737.1 DNA-binding MarR family transcriptional regulator [Brevirhabdus pacifica]
MKRSDISLIALRQILRATELYGRDLARAAGLTPVQIRVLQAIGEKGHATPKEISSRLAVSQATVTTLVDRLVGKGLVERQRSAVDRRQTNVLVTEAGRDALERAPDPLHDRYVKEFEKLADWEQAMIVAALERVASLLDAGKIPASPILDMGDFQKGAGGN